MWELNLFGKNVESKNEELLKIVEDNDGPVLMCNKTFWKKVLSKK